jgi:hypothetical protein
MEYEKGNFHALSFGAQVHLTNRDEFVFVLRGKDGEEVGIQVIYTHKLIRDSDAQFFLKLLKAKNSGIDVGIRIPF